MKQHKNLKRLIFSISLNQLNPLPHNSHNLFGNQRGQGLIEYMIIVALMGVAGIGIIRFLNQTVNTKYAESILALQGQSKTNIKDAKLNPTLYKRKDLSDFLGGATSSKPKK